MTTTDHIADSRSEADRTPAPHPTELAPAWWREAQSDQYRLCAELEDIADSLPSSIDRDKCLYAARTLGPLIRSIHRYEEQVLFPLLEGHVGSGPVSALTISRLKFEHFADECFAEELAERLLHLGAGDPGINMEATGYMLRGFFEGLRRHIAFEQAHLSHAMSARS